MSKFSVAALPEVFVSDETITQAVYDAVERRQLRKLGSRLYTRNRDEEPARLVRRHWYHLVGSYYPDAIISDRTALEGKPAEDGSVFLISSRRRETILPGLTLRPRAGPAALDSDRPFSGVRLASTARAYLENLRPTRSRGGRISRTVSRAELEERLDRMLRSQGEGAINRLRDEARALAPAARTRRWPPPRPRGSPGYLPFDREVEGHGSRPHSTGQRDPRGICLWLLLR